MMCQKVLAQRCSSGCNEQNEGGISSTVINRIILNQMELTHFIAAFFFSFLMYFMYFLLHNLDKALLVGVYDIDKHWHDRLQN